MHDLQQEHLLGHLLRDLLYLPLLDVPINLNLPILSEPIPLLIVVYNLLPPLAYLRMFLLEHQPQILFIILAEYRSLELLLEIVYLLCFGSEQFVLLYVVVSVVDA